MIPIIRIVGCSGSGKTTLIEKLIAELKSRGYKVATIKHSDAGFEMDYKGKDSWRYSQAGSDVSIVSARDKIGIIRKVESDLSPAELSRFLGLDFDIIITEGYKKDAGPKIEIYDKELSPELASNSNDLMAIVTKENLQLTVPQYTLEDVEGLADLIEESLLKQEQNIVSLFVNGEPIALNGFVTTIFHNVLIGMVSSLKRIKKQELIDIHIKRISRE